MKKNLPYVKCPRCELNYIPKDEELCDVCKAELKLIQSDIADEEEEILCPICKQNYISVDEDMCLKCVERLGDSVVRPEKEEEWGAYLDEDKEVPADDDLEIVSLSELEEEEKDSMFEDEEEAEAMPDDFDPIDGDVIIDEDFDDEEEDEDDEDDDF